MPDSSPGPVAAWVPSASPPETLTDGGVSLSRWRADDARILDDLIVDNIDHLRPTMPWIANEPLSLADRGALLAEWETAWRARHDFAYLLRHDGEPAGSAGLHVRQGAGVLEIGYWVARPKNGLGLASTAARLLADAALVIEGVHAVEIHHDAYNIASGRVAEKAGFTAISYYPRAPEAPDDSGTARRWVLLRG